MKNIFDSSQAYLLVKDIQNFSVTAADKLRGLYKCSIATLATSLRQDKRINTQAPIPSVILTSQCS